MKLKFNYGQVKSKGVWTILPTILFHFSGNKRVVYDIEIGVQWLRTSHIFSWRETLDGGKLPF